MPQAPSHAGDTLDELLASDTLKGPTGGGIASLDQGTALLPAKRKRGGAFEHMMGSTWFVIAVGAVLGGLIILAVVILTVCQQFLTK